MTTRNTRSLESDTTYWCQGVSMCQIEINMALSAKQMHKKGHDAMIQLLGVCSVTLPYVDSTKTRHMTQVYVENKALSWCFFLLVFFQRCTLFAVSTYALSYTLVLHHLISGTHLLLSMIRWTCFKAKLHISHEPGPKDPPCIWPAWVLFTCRQQDERTKRFWMPWPDLTPCTCRQPDTASTAENSVNTA